MLSKEFVVPNLIGLHSRAASDFIQTANAFKSIIWVEKNNRRMNAKSLLGVLSLGINKGVTINLVIDGADEQEAMEALEEFIMVKLLTYDKD